MSSHSALDWRQLVTLPDSSLASLDIAEVNLACAAGLPGTEKIELFECLRRIDDMAHYVSQYTKRVLARFPESGYTSEAEWRAAVQTKLMYGHLGVRYNMAKRNPDTALEPEDSFIHGIFIGAGGTCASLPVLFAAIGRRLGYPIKLAFTVGESKEFPGKIMGHTFARWEDSDERFNIDHFDGQIAIPPDEHYRDDYNVTSDMVRDGDLLKSLSPREEFAMFLRTRAQHMRDVKRFREAIEAITYACKYHAYHWNLQLMASIQARWHQELMTIRPRLMPGITIQLPARQWPWLPEELERGVFFMLGNALILKNPEYSRSWWDPMCRQPGYFPPSMPKHIAVRFLAHGATIELYETVPEWADRLPDSLRRKSNA